MKSDNFSVSILDFGFNSLVSFDVGHSLFHQILDARRTPSQFTRMINTGGDYASAELCVALAVVAAETDGSN